MNKSLKHISIFTLLISTQSVADCRTELEIPSSTPTTQFTNHGDGTVTDNKTGLMWAKCSSGQDTMDCTGSVIHYDWRSALEYASTSTHAGYSDWRLPNVRELVSLVEQRCVFPSINSEVFPNTPSSFYWSASPYANYSYYAWAVSFDDGGSFNYYRNRSNHVRLVRSGQ